MELKQIKELMTAMGRTGTKRLSLKKDNFELILEKDEQAPHRSLEGSIDLIDESPRPSAAWLRADQALSRGSEMPSRPAASSCQEHRVEIAGVFITSPMVGTFYCSPSPEDAPFVKVGDRVEKGTIVCIIEAMKVMNEIKANVSGTVAEVFIEMGQPVEFGSKLFRII